MRLRLPALAVLVLAVPAAAEDLTLVSRVTREGAPPTTATSYLSTDRVRSVQGDGQEVLMDLKTGQMTMIDGKKHEYFVVTKQDMEQMRTRVQQQMNSPEMQRAQEQMKSLPPEMQKRMQAMMGGLGAAITVQKTGTSRQVAGYACDNWTVSMGTVSKTESCMTTTLPLPMQVYDTYRDLAQNMQSMMASMGPMAKDAASIMEKFKEMKGFPLSSTTTVSMMGRSSSTSTEVTEVRKGPIPASAWEVPAGYTKIDNPMLKVGAPR